MTSLVILHDCFLCHLPTHLSNQPSVRKGTGDFTNTEPVFFRDLLWESATTHFVYPGHGPDSPIMTLSFVHTNYPHRRYYSQSKDVLELRGIWYTTKAGISLISADREKKIDNQCANEALEGKFWTCNWVTKIGWFNWRWKDRLSVQVHSLYKLSNIQINVIAYSSYTWTKKLCFVI